jgi:hypothetical protein
MVNDVATRERPGAALHPDLFDTFTFLDFESMGTWIRRRTETIRFSAANYVRRSVAVDVDLSIRQAGEGEPAQIEQQRETYAEFLRRWELPEPTRKLTTDALVVPVAVARKEVFAEFDLRDAAGSSIPLLTKEQNKEYARSILRGAALVDASFDLAPSLEKDLSREIERVVHFRDDTDTDVPDAAAQPDEFSPRFSTGANFTWAATVLATSFVMLAVVDSPPSRFVVKYSADLREVGATTGRTVRCSLESAFTQGSYHVEVHVPAGSEWACIQMVDRTGQHVPAQARSTRHCFHGVVPQNAAALKLRQRPEVTHPLVNAGVAAIAALVLVFTESGDVAACAACSGTPPELLWVVATLSTAAAGTLSAAGAHRLSRSTTRLSRSLVISAAALLAVYATVVTMGHLPRVADGLRDLGLAAAVAGLTLSLLDAGRDRVMHSLRSAVRRWARPRTGEVD